MSRKTIEVEKLFKMVNNYLKDSKPDQQGERRGLCGLLENVLMDTGHYAGFNHIHWNTVGYDAWMAAGKPDFPVKEHYITGGDDTRREYFWKD